MAWFSAGNGARSANAYPRARDGLQPGRRKLQRRFGIRARVREERRRAAVGISFSRDRTRSFPKMRLHRVRGEKQAIYRADVTKTSGWRIHLQYVDGNIVLKDVIEGNRRDDVIRVIKTKKRKFALSKRSA